MAIQVTGKNVVITGSTKGIGKAIAEAFAEAGANVTIVSRHQKDCDKVAADIAGRFHVKTLPVAGDVTSVNNIENIVKQTITQFGSIDVMVNNAGSAVTKPSEDLTEAEWGSVLDLDLKAVFFCSQIAGREMIKQKRGKIISIASALGLVGEKRVLTYCCAKGGVLQMTKALGLEWARYNIQVNAICPGYIYTDINRAELENEKLSSKLLAKIAMRRFGEVYEVADAAVFLASDGSNYMTGQPIIIDGGWCAE
jgi:NAD(P)-dependent dehydrogenase (short-subunit alcohol dehydrogenase family)